jgi:hypothetical protein
VDPVHNHLNAFDGMLSAMALSYPSVNTNTGSWTNGEDWDEDAVFFPFH